MITYRLKKLQLMGILWFFSWLVTPLARNCATTKTSLRRYPWWKRYNCRKLSVPEAKRSKKLGEQQQGYTISSFLFHIESSTPAIENWADENIGNKQSFPVFVGIRMKTATWYDWNQFFYVSVSHDPVKYLSRVSRDMKKKDIFTGSNNHRRSNHPLGSWLDFRAFLS